MAFSVLALVSIAMDSALVAADLPALVQKKPETATAAMTTITTAIVEPEFFWERGYGIVFILGEITADFTRAE